MEYYNLRKAGDDVDFIISEEDYQNLAKQYPQNLENLFGDRAVKVFEFELWTCIRSLDYKYLTQKAIDETDFLVINVDKYFLLKGLAALDDNLKPSTQKKYMKDLKHIAKKIQDIQYGKDTSVPKLTANSKKD